MFNYIPFKNTSHELIAISASPDIGETAKS